MFVKCFGAVVALTMVAVAAADDAAAAAAANDVTAAEPSAYSPAYLPPKFGALQHNPYEGAVASTSTDIVRTPGHHGQVAAYHKTVETPFSTAHVRSDQRFVNDAPSYPNRLSSAYPYSAPAYPYAAPAYPYAAPAPAYPYAAPAPAYPYAAPATGYPYAAAGAYPYKALPLAAVPPYGYGPVVAPPHSVAHDSFSGPYGANYSYKR